MTGEKEDAIEKLRSELEERLRAKGLGKDEKKKIRAQLVALSRSSKSAQREEKAEKKTQKKTQEPTPQEQARQDAVDLRTRVQFIMERQGAYRLAWIKYYNHDGSRTADLMRGIRQRLAVADNVADAVLAVAMPGEDLIAQLDAAVATVNDEVMPALVEVERLQREEEADSGTQVTVGDAMQVLDAMEAGCDPEQWATSVKHAKDGKRVFGSADIIARLTTLIERYVKEWDGLGTDGLKGASYKGIRRLAELRMEIVQAVAESGEPLLMACCRPGTDFYNYLGKLAAQTCSSRDVQMFVDWWQERGKTI